MKKLNYGKHSSQKMKEKYSWLKVSNQQNCLIKISETRKQRYLS